MHQRTELVRLDMRLRLHLLDWAAGPPPARRRFGAGSGSKEGLDGGGPAALPRFVATGRRPGYGA
ncbi:hypothetical protein GCM10023321_10270 [Pseudonocardia eucalypti]|uniref:Uncharacterized protein n=1 Tax=Pseudonocardia eucalypti TaxID=648755 RepID=A0ABP9PMP0_9PSEU